MKPIKYYILQFKNKGEDWKTAGGHYHTKQEVIAECNKIKRILKSKNCFFPKDFKPAEFQIETTVKTYEGIK